MHAKVVRPYSHSLSDDEKLYKTPAERAEEATRDPITKLAAWLQAEGSPPRPTSRISPRKSTLR
jgi:2-oxoisovalerate dehydrogenase E1 component